MAGGSSNAYEQAQARLRSGGGGPIAQPVIVPINMGRPAYGRPVNRGEFDGDIHTTGPKVMGPADGRIDRWDVNTDQGQQAALGAWYAFTDEHRSDLAKKMWFLGLVKDPNDFSAAYNVWKEAVAHASGFAAKGREIDPQDVLDMMGDAANGAGNKQQQGPVTRRQVDLTNPETAKAWITQAYMSSMGRAPEEAEVRALANAIAAKERANPKVSTTTSNRFDDQGNPITDGNGNLVDSTQVNSGGFDSQAYLQNRINEDPEATAHQAAGELYPALLAALGGGLS
jgi:hypothetical protein